MSFGREGARVLEADAQRRARLHDLRRRFGVLLVVAVIGMLLAFMHATSTAWWWQSVSALGVDPGADTWFNVAIAAIGVVFLWASGPLRAMLAEAVTIGIVRPGWGRIYSLGLLLIGPALVLVGVFEISSPVKSLIHDIAGFFVPLAVMGMMLTLGLGAPEVPRRVVGWSLVVLAAIVGLFLLAITERISYSLMEIVAFVICGAWVYAVAVRLDRRLDAAGRPPAAAGRPPAADVDAGAPRTSS
jgi:hypothetical protein